MKPYSKDLRLRVLAAASIDRGMSRKRSGKDLWRLLADHKTLPQKGSTDRSDVEPKPITAPPARKGAALDATLPQNRLGSTPI
jgi:hypothetical protein